MIENYNLIEDIYGKNVFSKAVMKKRLKPKTFSCFEKKLEMNEKLNIEMADEIAESMRKWAQEKGVTHYAHWFQPLNGKTAEKHDSFIEITRDGDIITRLSGKELIKGESDASSFPSGGLRSTFEARGYTIWDITSPAFIIDTTLFIPSVFYSYNEEALDHKIPLLRSEEELSNKAVKILNLLGNNDVKKVTSNVGAEQEYFLIDKGLYEKRKDLKFLGRTLFGNTPIVDTKEVGYYYSTIDDRVLEFMKEVDFKLWQLGIPSKTRHNEASPMQHELAVIYTNVNIACDNNELIMDILKKTAEKHNLICLLHEKPFEKINGSGKHNNWSLETDNGINIFKPGKTPENNIPFLLFVVALIRGIDKYAMLLRASVSSLSNDLRLGGFEAPPNIISIFLGEDLTNILEQIEKGNKESKIDRKERSKTDIGISKIPSFLKDLEDRNRTSPFAFTGNKFEFRMVGSSQNISFPNVVLMALLIDSLDYIYEKLKQIKEKTKSIEYKNKSKQDKNKDKNKNENKLETLDMLNLDMIDEIYKLIGEMYSKHKRVIFNGDGYSKKWYEEAKIRNLPLASDTYEAIEAYNDEKSIKLLTKYKILSKKELLSKYKIEKEKYKNELLTEAKVMTEIISLEIMPSVNSHLKELFEIVEKQNKFIKENLGDNNSKSKIKSKNKLQKDSYLVSLINDILELQEKLYDKNEELKLNVLNSEKEKNNFDNKIILKNMNEIRSVVDVLESIVAKKVWPYPTYEELLHKL